MDSTSLPALPSDAIVVAGSRPVTDTRTVAQVFGKKHKDVLRAIRKLQLPGDWGRRNFAPSSYMNAQDKTQPMYNITRDGFVLLAMGFTGREAMMFKLAYIEAFNAMEAKLADEKATAGTGNPILDLIHTMANALGIVDQARLAVALDAKVKFSEIFPAAVRRVTAPQREARQIPDEDRLTTTEACARLGVSSMTLYRWEKRGRLIPHRTTGGRVWYDAKEVDAARNG